MAGVTEVLIQYVKCKNVNSPLGGYLYATKKCKFGTYWPEPSNECRMTFPIRVSPLEKYGV